jgi:plastocyanin
MKTWKYGLTLSVAAVAWACTQSYVSPSSTSTTSPSGSTGLAGQGLTLAATIEFGNPGTGSSFPPAEHDRSFHAPDTLVPETAVIDADGTVTFNVNGGVHQVAIYEPGIGVRDIDTTLLTPSCLPFLPPLIDDPSGRVAVLDAQPCGGGANVLQYTFSTPGRYLVICTFLPHFADAQMYGWVVVRDRP